MKKKSQNNPATKQRQMVTISEAKLEELITKIVAKRLNEDSSFNAIRTLTVDAQHAALKFENDIVKALNLVDPNTMGEVEQDVYAHVMADLHQTFANAVANAARAVSRLPKNPTQDKPQDKSKAGSSPVTAVKKDLPTLG